jgi:REP element-mobilizing transposase RayT
LGVSFYRRRLPHWQPEGVPIFLTWRLFGSLPECALVGRSVTCPTTEGQRFVAIDRRMDRATTGPTWLRNPQIAQAVRDTVVAQANLWGLYDLFAWVLMSNHVHMLVQPRKPLREITRAVKNTSARGANLILGRTGTPFWQEESFDHWVRDRDEFERIARYIEENPVSAGLVERAELWPWSSASSRNRGAGPRPAPLEVPGW